ncbi:MAG: spermidine synthase [Burkholderiaceae bacterium]
MPTPRALELPEVSTSELDGVRYLHLGTEWVQGSMEIKKPFAIELDYVQRMMAWLLWADLRDLGSLHTMQLGLGSAALTKFCYKHVRCRATAVEINPDVISACKAWFKLPDNDTRLQVLLADAGAEIAKTERMNTVDALQVDLYDHDAAAPVLDSLAFYKDCRASLTEQGIMTVNLFGRMASYDKSVEKISKAFGAENVWAFKPTREGNAIVLAHRSARFETRAKLSQNAETIYTRFGLPAHKWLRIFKPLP